MCQLFLSTSAALNSLVSETIPVLLGLISGWVLFTLTERRREAHSQRELRCALVAELENGEVLTNNIVLKYARLYKSATEIADCAGEIRWFFEIGRKRMETFGILSGRPNVIPNFESLSDSQLIALFPQVNETVGNKLIMPVLDRALSGQTFGFSANQIKALSMVRWQIFLLAQDAESMHEMLQLSFTVTAEHNHNIVLKNHDKQTLAYAQRALVVLRAMRSALEAIR